MPPPPSQRLPVVFDTNALEEEGWSLSSARMRIVQHEAQAGAMTLYIPGVVKLELAQHGKDAAVAEAKRYRVVVGKLAQLGASDDLDRDAELAIDAYPARLDTRLAEFGAEVLAIPPVPHEDLVRRAIDGRKPFRDRDRGYRDTLIWMTVLELLGATGTPVALVSKDGDFRDGGEDLAADLVADLKAAGYGPDAVRLYRSVGQLITAEVPQIRKVIAQITQRLAEDEAVRERLVAWMIALADEDGPAMLEPALLAGHDVQPSAVRFGSFRPDEAPTVDEAGEPSAGATPLVLSLGGNLDVLISLDPRDRRLPLTTPLRSPRGSELVLRDTVIVVWKFEANYDDATQEVRDLRLVTFDLLVSTSLPALIAHTAQDESLSIDQARRSVVLPREAQDESLSRDTATHGPVESPPPNDPQ